MARLKVGPGECADQGSLGRPPSPGRPHPRCVGLSGHGPACFLLDPSGGPPVRLPVPRPELPSLHHCRHPEGAPPEHPAGAATCVSCQPYGKETGCPQPSLQASLESVELKSASSGSPALSCPSKIRIPAAPPPTAQAPHPVAMNTQRLELLTEVCHKHRTKVLGLLTLKPPPARWGREPTRSLWRPAARAPVG